MTKIKAILLSLSALILSATIILAAYTADIAVTNNSTIDYNMIGINITANIDYMAANDYFDSIDGLDTRVLSGTTELPHLLTDDKILFALPIPNSSSRTLTFSTGSSNLTSFSVITGYGGSVNVTDAPNLEQSNNSTVEVSGYIDTNNGTDKNLVYKENSFRLFVSENTTGNITAELSASSGWTSPTGHVDPNAFWINEANAYDRNTATSSGSGGVATGAWSSYLWLTHTYTTINSIRAWTGTAAFDLIEVDVFYGGAWNNIYSGAHTSLSWQTYNVGSYQSSNATRIRLHNAGAPGGANIYEVVFGVFGPAVSATGLSSGEYKVTVTANTTHLWIDVNTVTQNTVAIGSASVNNTTSDWTFFQNNVMPYADNITISVNGTQQLYFAPDTIILGTNLPDRGSDGIANNGTITWGDNPTGIDVTLGNLVSDYSVGSQVGDTSSDVVPVVYGMVNPNDAAKLALLADDPFITFAEGIETATSGQLPVLLQYWWLYLILALVAFIIVYGYFPNLILGGIAFCAVIGIAVALGIYDFWIIAVLATFLVGLAMVEGRRTV